MTASLNRVQELIRLASGDQDPYAAAIAHMWDRFKADRQEWEAERLELFKYLFATDTTKTSNSRLPWVHKTVTPKLTQIRDNLHANYMAALFPNDEWLKWEGYNIDDETELKRNTIEAYMQSKLRESNAYDVISQWVYDYIDYGMAFSDVTYVSDKKMVEGELVASYVGPKLIRISPWDHVFDTTASSYQRAPKITRYVKQFGELVKDLENLTEDSGWIPNALEKAYQYRTLVSRFGRDDFQKAALQTVYGYNDLWGYLSSGACELLEFEGDFYDTETNTLLEDYVITIIDRKWVVRMEQNPSWFKYGTKNMVNWRNTQESLVGMGPLDNLVGIQYRIDHLENMKATAYDMGVLPPVVVRGDVENFTYQPHEVIDGGDEGEVTELAKNVQWVLAADNQIQYYMNLMEEMAGAPRQGLGFRTPGEKTAFEVQAQENRMDRIFASKTQKFEINFLEPTLNNFLESARRNIDGAEVVRALDDDLGAVVFSEITKDDITAKGKIRPVGARHFAARAQLVQNLVALSNSPIWIEIAPHRSAKALASLVEDAFMLSRYDLFSPNIAVSEQMETQRQVQQATQTIGAEAQTPTGPTDGDIDESPV